MVSPSPCKSSKTNFNNGRKSAEDRISKLPEGVRDKILQLMPISDAAKMSVLSRKWLHNWSCLTSLRFDYQFHIKLSVLDWQRFSSTISNVLLLHQGPILDFLLEIPNLSSVDGIKDINLNLSRWLCFLLRSGVKKIALYSNASVGVVSLPSHIYFCKELEEVTLNNFHLNPPSIAVGFKSFMHVTKLKLVRVTFFRDDLVGRLIAACSKLVSLMLRNCSGVNHLIINAPRLENVNLEGKFKSLIFKNVPNLAQLQLHLIGEFGKQSRHFIANEIKNLASSCRLRSLYLGDRFLKILGADGLTKQLPLVFTYITELSLLDLDLDDSDVFSCTIALLQSCPSLKTLTISADASIDGDIQHEFDYSKINNSYKLGHLREVKWEGVMGLRAELKLIEYLLSVSIVLENLFLNWNEFIDETSELEVHIELNRFQRASPKARIVSYTS